MVNPVPGFGVSTGYRKSGKWWKACGWHTGVDIAAPRGTPVVAARPGKVKHTAYGTAFGDKQFAIVCADGSEDFYAHTDSRPINGKRVEAGDRVAKVGSRGQATGPHLHFERHAKAGTWTCANMRDPKASLDYKEAGTVNHGTVYLSKLVEGQRDSDSVSRLQVHLNAHKLAGGSTLPVTGNFLDGTAQEVRLCQQQHGFGDDPPGSVSVGPKQAAHLFTGCACTVVDDRLPVPPPEPELPPITEPEVPVSAPKFIYRYSGKPADDQNVGTSYVQIDKSRFTPPADGLLLSMQYVNAAHVFKDGVDSAGFRLRSVREPYSGAKEADYSGYGDYTPNRRLTTPGSMVVTHIWFEMCEGGRPVHWECDRSSAFKSFTLGTRYTKWVWLSEEVFAPLAVALGGRDAVVKALRTFMEHAPDDEGEIVL